MADLIGTASIRVDSNTTAAARSIRSFATQADGSLRNLQRRITQTSTELGRLRGTDIAVTIDDQTRTGVTAVRTAVTGLQALGPVRIPVSIGDDTGPGDAAIRATIARMQGLGPVRINARVDVDAAQTANAASALRGLQDAARGAARALGTLATRATAATAALALLGTQASSLRGDMDDLDGSIRRAGGGMAGLRGRLGTLTTTAASAGGALGGLRSAAVLLAPALIPIVAQAVPIAASLAAATAAIGAFGLAAGGQIAALSEAADAEKKYKDAVDEFGATSQQAAKAQAAFRRSVDDMPHPTRVAAVALSNLKDQYRQWSDSLAASTMPVATRSFALFGAIFPKLTPLVEGAGAQLKRFVTIAAGGVQSSAFDQFMRSFAEFSTGALQRGNDALIRFTRTLNTGKISGGASEFMEYVRANGPLVRDTLSNLAQALGNILQGAANVGPGLLTVVNALAGLVAAVPPGVITAMLQLALALKAVRLAAAGMAAAGVAAASFGAAVTAMRTAAAGATGVLPRLAAAFGTLSRSAKVAVAGTGIGLLLIALTELSQRGREAPPDVDKLTTSLARLGRTGQVAGEGAKAFGDDLDGLHGKVSSLTDPSTTDKVQQFLVGWTGWDSTPVKEAKENLDSVDKALANLVKNGQSDLAAAALKRLTAEYGKGGRDTKEFTSRLDDYKASLEDAKFEQQLAADAMGLFGQQAQATSAKLAAQKQSADGLRQAIQALNDVNRAGLGGMIGFEAALDAASKAAQENAGVLSMQGGQLSLNTEKQRAAATALSDLGTKTDEAAAAARESGASWQTVNGIYERGRQTFISSAMAMGLTKEQARQLAAQILKVPSGKKITMEMRTEDAINGLNGVIAAMKATPNAKSVTVKALTSDAVSLLQELGFKVKKMPDGRFKVTAETGTAKSNIAAVQKARDRLKDKSITLSARDRASATASAVQRAIDKIRSKTVTLRTVRHTINIEATVARNAKNLAGYASGGTPRRGEMAIVGEEGPEIVTFGQDARVFDAATTKRMMTSTAGAGRAAAQGLAAGLGSTAGVYTAARAMAAAVTGAVRRELQISSPSKKMQKIGKDTGAGFVKGLNGTKSQINSTAKSMASAITSAFKGTGSRTDDRLVSMISKNNKKLQALAGQRDSIAKKIADARKFSTDTASKAQATGSLGSIVQADYFAPSFVEKRMKASLASIKAFTSNVQKLQKKGLSKALLRQILEMGPEQGAAFAKSLAGADKSTIKRYNSIQSDIGKQSSKLGKVGADMLYDSGKKAGAGFLTGLKAQQKSIEALMLNIAKGMQKAIRKALKIKSPSQVFAAIGRNVGDGLAQGLSASSPKVAEAAKRLSSAAAVTAKQAAASRRAGAAAAAAPKSGYGSAVAELQKLVDSGRWRKGGSMLFEDVSFQGMSKNFRQQQMKVADGFWAAVGEIKKAVKSGKKVLEDMTFKGMSGNVNRFHDMIAQVWKGNPYGRNFGDWGNFGSYGRYGKYAGGGPIKGPGTSTSDSVPIWASRDEFMMQAAAVSHYGLPAMNALNSMRIPRQAVAAPAVSSMRTGGRAAASAPSGDLHVHIHNDGVIGSQLELDNWLTKSIARLAQQRRLPAAVGGRR